MRSGSEEKGELFFTHQSGKLERKAYVLSVLTNPSCQGIEEMPAWTIKSMQFQQNEIHQSLCEQVKMNS